MVLDARHHADIYRKLVPVLGDDNTNALMSTLPTTEADQLVTRQILHVEMADLRAELRGEMNDLRVEMADLRGEVGADIAGLRADMNDRFRRQTVWMTSMMFAGMALITAVNRAVA